MTNGGSNASINCSIACFDSYNNYTLKIAFFNDFEKVSLAAAIKKGPVFKRIITMEYRP
jgi:hypothetical protein